MSSVQRSESTAAQYGEAGPVTAAIDLMNTGATASGTGTIIFTSILSGVTTANLGWGVATNSGSFGNPAGFLQASVSNYISGGRIVIPFYYQASGVP